MTKATDRTTQRQRIEQHGRNLLAVFPDATERDPYNLCRKLRRLEAKAEAIALRQCNGPEWPSELDMEAEYGAVLTRVANLLLPNGNNGDGPVVFINRDPRGYALKVSDEWQRKQKAAGKPYIGQEDWGGYGLIAPEIK